MLKIQQQNMKRQKKVYKDVTTQRIFRNIIFKDIIEVKRQKKWMIFIIKEQVPIDKCKDVKI